MRALFATLGIVFLTACASQPPSKPAPPAPPPVMVTGGILVNSNGMTLYTYDRDVAGSQRSNCNGECAFIWPPLGAGDGKPSGDFSIIVREGGQRQWCYKGKPLYLFSGDANPGDTSGNGMNGVWQIATP
jgi:predicted lipoprotein with Yx(FWY)xxD motif